MRYDVAIVGAGPAGSTAAKFLSEKGVRTLLLEKTVFPRDKPCGGGLPMRVLHRFKYIAENNLIDSYSFAIQIHAASMIHHLDFQHNKPLQAMVRRKIFDEGLANIAKRSGAVLQCGETVQDVTTDKEHIRIFLSNGTIVESQVLIGADGTWSTVAKKIGMKHDCNHIGVCVYNEYPMGQETLYRLYGDERAAHIHLQPAGLAGYGWVFPKERHTNIGIVEFRQAINPATEKKNLQHHYALYIQALKKQQLIPNNLNTSVTHGGVFPTCPAKKITANRVVLCGDAGGLVNPSTGEGIYYAMCSGEIAAKTAIKALEHDETNVRLLKRYQRQWNHEFHSDFSLFSKTSKYWNRNIDRLIELANKDKKLIAIACNAIPSPGGIQQEKWRIAVRLIVAYCKDRFGLT
jgi:geranylgeranyl reductase family protein